MTRARRGAATAAPTAALLVLCYLLLELLPALLGRTDALPLTRPPVLEPVRLLALVLLEAVMPVAVAVGVLLLLRRTSGRERGREQGLEQGREQGRGRRAELRLRALGVLAGTVGSAELLKWLLPAVRSGTHRLVAPGHGSFPSGHTATAVALALLLAAVPPRTAEGTPDPAPVLGPGVAWSVAVATGTLVAQWHRPADALGGALLAAAWYRLLLPGRGPAPAGPVTAWWLLATVPAVLAVAASWWSVPHPVHRVLPHLAVIVLLAVAVGLVIRWAAPGPAAPPG